MVFISPSGLAAAPTANSLSILATYKEDLCKAFCVVSSNQPNATVTYTTESPKLNGTTVFVMVVAKVAITLPNCGVKTYTERFMTSFQGQTALPTAVNITSVGMEQGFFNVGCVKSKCYAINDAITVSITPPAAAAA